LYPKAPRFTDDGEEVIEPVSNLSFGKDVTLLPHNQFSKIDSWCTVFKGDDKDFALKDLLIWNLSHRLHNVAFDWTIDPIPHNGKARTPNDYDNIFKQADYHRETAKVPYPIELTVDNIISELDRAYQLVNHNLSTVLIMPRHALRLYYKALGLDDNLGRPIQYKGMGVIGNTHIGTSRFMFNTDNGLLMDLDLSDTHFLFQESVDNGTIGKYTYSFKVSISIAEPKNVVVY
jgi:hypothetical protein